ncbi:hypothetical protein V8Z80_05135 [Orrella sp. JC864]|uniref:hypothetical protein n=1 Tax=Orrella sp. JC864 TaxID=3120298 RepID=UPI00300A3D2F
MARMLLASRPGNTGKSGKTATPAAGRRKAAAPRAGGPHRPKPAKPAKPAKTGHDAAALTPEQLHQRANGTLSLLMLLHYLLLTEGRSLRP